MALIPPFFLDCVVVIGKLAQQQEVAWIASGFFYADFQKKIEGGRYYLTYLVTNRHILEELDQICLMFNPTTKKPAKQYQFNLETWASHPNSEIDVAVTSINVESLRNQGIQLSVFQSDQHIVTLNKIAELGITKGDFVYTLGFPMGLVGEKRNYVIARSGSIARIRDAVNRESNEFLIDSFVFPGNSGGPVVIKPEAMAIQDTKSVSVAYLIGIVKGYIPYKDVAVSVQTKRPRVIFEENSGLTAVIPVDFIQETIKEYDRKFEKRMSGKDLISQP